MAPFLTNCGSEFIPRDVMQSRVFLQTATDNLEPNYRTGGCFGGGRAGALQSAGNPPPPPPKRRRTISSSAAAAVAAAFSGHAA